MRIFTAAFATETNTFSPICIDRRAFEASLYAPPGQHPATPTLCTAPITVGREVCGEKDWVLIEGTATWADPAGLVNRQTYESLRDEILDQLTAALPVNAVLLGLHGAMVADGYLDPEGDFLSRIRAIIGPDVLLAAELDPHSHLTAKRVEAADVFVVFKEFPHTDFVDRARDLWRIVVDTLEGGITPVMSVFDCRMIDVFPTSRQPMRGFVDKMLQIEREDPDVLSLSVIHGFMAGDVPEMGTKTIAITNGKVEKGQMLARSLGLELFEKRGTFMMPQIDEKQAVAEALANPAGPVVIADMWDNPGGGTAGDATVLLEELLAQGATNTAVGMIWDPIAVQICMAAGEGAEIPLRFGAKSAPGTGNPVDGLVKVVKLVPNAEMQFGESVAPFGDAAHIHLDGIDIVLSSVRVQSYDPSLFTALGIDPTSKHILAIKSTNHFYAAFSKIASDILYCSAGSPYPNNPATNPYRRVRRDIWPICANPFNLAQDTETA
ncbi:microcystin LR degradation protein MlrC-like protein [Agrobacterium vitis]|uniref:M81 family metallopeptidase n=1 Tax=Rhizobium/Agrobacterium group TaxID=227290 RepID=UPI0008DBEB23|nr:M81 family metallopeptidase [Agrobacterium vitis]MCF1432371.1 M81 family metallopeptidase [Allorhizobium ampelinum]MUO88093.1 microcystin LR degradation protein MlrC-like protein [Agrobacterium vitis]MUZ50778.1 microcystin LR degradation protein MlrC-like protein [Agrobacterium vitis]MUZ90894.1 microcystin LR degradation protein MlrC-like protein [Agrobacterium vitis]MVA38841.1 microcystin LR degradation protein MlrC-like protein [Agrobacterium vitis]